MFYLAAFPQFMPTGEHAISSAAILVMIHALMNAAWFAMMVVLFARLSGLARRGAFQRWLKGVTGLVFVGFGVRLATYRA
jgi:threonine/homoserine/homoserine lactone efflux protein